MPELQAAIAELTEHEDIYSAHAEYWLLRAVGHEILHPSEKRHSIEQTFRIRANRCKNASVQLEQRCSKLLIKAAKRRRKRAKDFGVFRRYDAVVSRAQRHLTSCK
ncbi:MAG: hypothetical protein ACHQTE_00250 [Candidatus Saccharimonadales bacterium]